MKNNCIGLVGCGAWGKNILRDLLALGCRVHVADSAAAARVTALARGAETSCADAADLPGCDGFVVAVPIPQLAPECLALLKRQKPVFSEKTLCLSLETADELQKAGGREYLFAMHKWHYHPGIEALREIALSGSIGRLRELATTRHGWVEDFHGGDVFWTLAVHDLTIIEHILGHLPEEVLYARTAVTELGLPISLNAVLGRDPAANISVNARHAHKISGVSVHGDRGSAVLRDAYDDHITVRNENGTQTVGIDTTFPLYLELQEFVAYLQGGPKPRCGLLDARRVTRLLLALREKSLSGT